MHIQLKLLQVSDWFLVPCDPKRRATIFSHFCKVPLGIQGSAIELTTRVAVLLLRLHHSQLVATASARPLLLRLHKRLHPAVQVSTLLGLVVGFSAVATD